MSNTEAADSEEFPFRKRRRGPQACSLCRQRKVKCNGNLPCTNCAASDAECVYGTDPITKGKSDTLIDKSDAILNSLLRLDDRLTHLTEVVTAAAPSAPSYGTGISAAFSPQTATSTEPSLVRRTRVLARDPRQDERRLDNAAMSARHASTTESVLAWSYFDAFPSLRHNYQSIFTLEQHRPSVVDYEIAEAPAIHVDEIRATIASFETVVNFAYPTVAVDRLEDVERRVREAKLDNSIETCHALLIMALGCASQTVSLIDAPGNSTGKQHRSRDLALVYFDLVLKRLQFIQLEVSTTATQCLFFTA